MKVIEHCFFSLWLVFGLICMSAAEEVKEETVKKIIEEKKEVPKNPLVLIQTNYGDFTLEVYLNETPVHAGNFLKNVDEGYYDSLTFHRVVRNFVIQGGDPTGTGMGGPEGVLPDEESPFKHDRGTVAMARNNLGAHKSQFYINLADNYRLDDMGFSIFARVIERMDVVDKIAAVKTRGPQHSTPEKPVIMTKVTRKK